MTLAGKLLFDAFGNRRRAELRPGGEEPCRIKRLGRT